jgi:hypothetical protein
MDDINITQPSPDEGYLVDVTEASEILGVSRTRLSQLTTKGEFSFQRRKIGTRNRLFYKRSDLYSYMRDQSKTVEGLRDPRQARILGASSQPSGQTIPLQLDEGLEASLTLHTAQQNELLAQLQQMTHSRFSAGVPFRTQRNIPKLQQDSAAALKQKQFLLDSIESIQTAIASLSEIVVNQDKSLSTLSRQISALNLKSQLQSPRKLQTALTSDFMLLQKEKMEPVQLEGDKETNLLAATSKVRQKNRHKGKRASPRIQVSIFR